MTVKKIHKPSEDKEKMNFKLNETQLSGVFLIQRTRFNDERGYFTEFFREDYFKSQFTEINFVQENLSFSRKGVIRGLHFQKLPFSQGKLVSVIHGKILDVAVNLKSFFLACSSKACVPIIFDLMKDEESFIELSTCDSAATISVHISTGRNLSQRLYSI